VFFGRGAVEALRRTAIATLAVAALAPVASPAAASSRALELVTPTQPGGGTVQATVAIAADGSRVAYFSLGPMPGAPAGDLTANSVASRGEEGWTNAPIGLPYEMETVAQEPPVVLRALSGDLLTTIWTADRPVAPSSPPPGRSGLYRRPPDGGTELLADLGASQPGFVAAAVDARRVVFSSTEHLLPSDAGRGQGESIYEAGGPEGLRQVDRAGGGGLLTACGSRIDGPNAVSRSGDRVFFVNPHPSTACPQASRVYLRENGAATVEVSASRCGRPDCGPERDVAFAGATPDGGIAFLATAQQLTDADLDDVVDLYRYERAGEDLVLFTGAADGGGLVLAEPVLASEDGERVYLRAQGSLVAGDGAASGRNLYLADDAGLNLIAPLDSSAAPPQISADGRFVLLETNAALLPGDGDGRRDVYRYDAELDGLEPVSFGSGFGGGPFDANVGSVATFGIQKPPFRALSADGRHAFFSTAEPLAASDADGASDVYEWAGGASEPISGGASGEAGAELAGVSADASTALFRTAATLLPEDRDGGEFDLYAARVGGGFPSGEPPLCPCDADPTPPRLDRPVLATLRPARPRATGRLRLRGSARALLAALARRGRATLLLSVPGPGRVEAILRARLGQRKVLLARGSAGAARGGKVRVPLRATRRGRSLLARRQRPDLLLTLSQGLRRLERRIGATEGAR
jgi:hypothetical protein